MTAQEQKAVSAATPTNKTDVAAGLYSGACANPSEDAVFAAYLDQVGQGIATRSPSDLAGRSDDSHEADYSGGNSFAWLHSGALAVRLRSVFLPDDSTLTDLSDCLRLFIGTNITVFPYIVSLGGAFGSLIVVFFCAAALLEGVFMQLRAKRTLLVDVMQDYSQHAEINSFARLSDALFARGSFAVAEAAQSNSGALSGVSTASPNENLWNPAVGGNGSRAAADERKPSLSFGAQLWPMAVSVCIVLDMFFLSCSFTMLVADNLAPVTGMSLTAAISLSCFIMCAMLILHTPTTMDLYAAINNICLLGSGVILTYATLTHQNDSTSSSDESAAAGAIWFWPLSVTAVLLQLPLACGYLAGSLYAPEEEAHLCARYVRVLAQREQQLCQQQRQQPKEMCEVTAAAASANAVVCGVSSAPTRERTEFILKRFQKQLVVSFILTVIVLTAFGQFIFATFTTHTNAVVALTLMPGLTRSVLMVDLIIGVSFCGALNVAALPELADSLALHRVFFPQSEQRQQKPQTGETRASEPGERVVYVALRVLLIAFVFTVIMTVPFFDLLATFGSALGSNFSFIFPAVFEVQSARRALAVRRGAHHDSVSWSDGFWSLSARSRVAVSLIAAFGCFTLVGGSSIAVMQVIARS